MSFYIVPVLLPALFVDILITIGLFQRRKARRLYLWEAAFVATPLYFMSAIAWVIFYVGDPRFQRFGSLGLIELLRNSRECRPMLPASPF